MTLKHLILSFLIMLLSSCESTSPHMRVYNPIEAEHFSFIQKQGSFHVDGNGGNFNQQSINLIIASTKKIGSANIESARKDMIFLTQDIIKRMNSSQNIQKYLSKFPFDQSHLKYSIAYCMENGLEITNNENDNVSYVFLLRGTIFYNKRTSNKSPYKTIHKESYEEALEILKNQGICF